MEKKNGFRDFIFSKGGRVFLIIVLYAIIYLLMGYLSMALSDFAYAGLFIGIFLGIFGWKALNKIQPDIFLILPLVGWVIFFVVKGILSVIVGIFVAPYVIGNAIAKKIQSSL